MVKQCRQLYPELDFEVGDAKAIEAKDGSADLVLSIAVLEYYENPIPLIIELARVIRPKGAVIVAVPNRTNRTRRLEDLVGSLASRTKRLLYGQSEERPSALRHDKDERVKHRRYDLSEMVELGDKVGLRLTHHSYVSILSIPNVSPSTHRLNERISWTIGNRRAWRWLTRFAATILICQYQKR